MEITNTMSQAVLDEHLNLCQQAEDLISEENRLLHDNPKELSQSLVERKQQLLNMLSKSVEQLKQLRQHAQLWEPKLQATIQKCQKKLMKIFLLDRENERLILQSTMPAKPLTRQVSTRARVENLYQQS